MFWWRRRINSYHKLISLRRELNKHLESKKKKFEKRPNYLKREWRLHHNCLALRIRYYLPRAQKILREFGLVVEKPKLVIIEEGSLACDYDEFLELKELLRRLKRLQKEHERLHSQRIIDPIKHEFIVKEATRILLALCWQWESSLAESPR